MATRRQVQQQQRKVQLEEEAAELAKINPLLAAERLRNHLALEVDRALQQLSTAIGEINVDRALVAASVAHRRYIAFSHELAVVSGKRIYEVRNDLYSQIGSEHLQRRLRVLRGRAAPTAPLPEGARKILEAIRAITPPLNAFEL